MKKPIHLALLLIGATFALGAVAKLPPPSDEAKAKAAEAAAKTAWAGKKDGFLLCKAQDKVAARYKSKATDSAKAAVKGAPAPASTCTDPGPFVYTPPDPAAAPAAAAPAAPAAQSAAAAVNPAAPKKP